MTRLPSLVAASSIILASGWDFTASLELLAAVAWAWIIAADAACHTLNCGRFQSHLLHIASVGFVENLASFHDLASSNVHENAFRLLTFFRQPIEQWPGLQRCQAEADAFAQTSQRHQSSRP